MNETRRINRGSGHSYVLDGEPVLGVTTILRLGIPKPAFENAAVERTAGYAIDHWAELEALSPSVRLKRIATKGRHAWNEAAVRGTKIHDFAARLLGGETVDPPDELTGYVDACLAFLEDWNVREIAVEIALINRQFRYMGTADLIAEIDGETWLVDWKTSASGIWPETALQCAAYARAETWLVDGPAGPAAHEITAKPIDRAAGVHLRADGYEVRPLEIGDDVFRTFLNAQRIARFADAARGDYVRDAIYPRAGEAAS